MDVKESPGGLTDLSPEGVKHINLTLKDSLIMYLSPKISKNVKIGIYTDTVFHKKKGLEKIIKYTKKKFFIKNDSQKAINYNLELENFLEKFPQFIKYNDMSKNSNNNFSPNVVLNGNFTDLFNSLQIKATDKTPFAICFIREKEISTFILEKINLIKDKFNNNFYIYTIKKESDKYAQYEQYTLFFKEKKINYWIENDCYDDTCFNDLLNYNTLKNNENNGTGTSSILNSDSIKNYLDNHSKPADEYILKNKYYEYYDKDGNISSFYEFPTFMLAPIPDEHFNDQIFYVTSEKIDVTSYLINEINKFNVKSIEIFKERINSFLLRNYFITKKKFSLFLSPTEPNNYLELIKKIKEEINPCLKNINKNYGIENVILLPEIGSKFNYFDDGKLIYAVVNYSTCIKFIKSHLKQKYDDIYGRDATQIICIYKNGEKVSEKDLKLNVLYISEKTLMKDNNKIDFYIHSFNPVNYFSHLLIITDLEGSVQYANYFKNRASIFVDYLKEEQLGIEKSLPLIESDNFKNVKNFYSEKMKNLLDNIPNNTKENIIDFNDNKLLESYYKNKIFFQPYLSLKYNKVINLSEDDEKNYKNYSLNFINFADDKEIIQFSENEHKPLNEISHIYNEKDEFILIQKEFRCKECHEKINETKHFYLCPIAKDVICEKCFNKTSYELNYPFNLLYINCKNKINYEHLPKDNILLFRDKVNYDNHPEILDELCDICSLQLCNNDDTGYSFYVLINIIRKNNFLICNNCFKLLNDETRSWIFNNKYNYIYELLLQNFVDLDNLIFKKVKLV